MFSGIIKTLGRVESIEIKGTTKAFTISSSISSMLQVDQSISHDGACLTIVQVDQQTHTVEVVLETLSKTTFGQLQEGQLLNLERSISSNTLLDGHLVQGHVDATLYCLDKEDLTGSWKFRFNLPEEFKGLVIPQGSICINGVSLTVADLEENSFCVAIIPYTYEHTTFKYLEKGVPVNVEFDVIGKYIIRQMELRNLTE